MSKVYFTSVESEFAKKLADIFKENGYEVTTVPEDGTEFFIDTTYAQAPGDDRTLLEGIDQQAALLSYRKNVCEPLAALTDVMPHLTGKKRICFLSGKDSSINYSEAVSGYGRNMSKAALHQILTMTKIGLINDGFTFRLFDPLDGKMPADKAAASAFVYFTRDRFHDEPRNPAREDEANLILRDALGREIPW